MVLPPLSALMTGVSSLSATHAWPFMCIQHSEPWLPRCQLRKLEPTAQDKPPGLCHRTHCTCWVNFTLSLYLLHTELEIERHGLIWNVCLQRGGIWIYLKMSKILWYCNTGGYFDLILDKVNVSCDQSLTWITVWRINCVCASLKSKSL